VEVVRLFTEVVRLFMAFVGRHSARRHDEVWQEPSPLSLSLLKVYSHHAQIRREHLQAGCHGDVRVPTMCSRHDASTDSRCRQAAPSPRPRVQHGRRHR
jgi:hypothetical protein